MKKSSFTGNFNKSLRWGKYFEFETIPFIEETFNKVLKPQNKKIRFLSENLTDKYSEMKAWDVCYEILCTITGERLKTITFEIKADGYPSNNIYVEYKYKRELSGVFTTKADYFLYILPRHNEMNVYLAKPSDIANHLLSNWKTHLSYGGDGNKSFGYLIDRQHFNDSLKGIEGVKIFTHNFKLPQEFQLEKNETVTDTGRTYSSFNSIAQFKSSLPTNNINSLDELF